MLSHIHVLFLFIGTVMLPLQPLVAHEITATSTPEHHTLKHHQLSAQHHNNLHQLQQHARHHHLPHAPQHHASVSVTEAANAAQLHQHQHQHQQQQQQHHQRAPTPNHIENVAERSWQHQLRSKTHQASGGNKRPSPQTDGSQWRAAAHNVPHWPHHQQPPAPLSAPHFGHLTPQHQRQHQQHHHNGHNGITSTHSAASAPPSPYDIMSAHRDAAHFSRRVDDIDSDDDDDDDDFNYESDDTDSDVFYDFEHLNGIEQPARRVTREHQPMYSHDYDRSSSEDYQNDDPGVLTAQKENELGTREAVMQQFEKHYKSNALVLQNVARVRDAIKCKNPLPRVVRVSNDSSKRYEPSCTILHRCGEDTGCCQSEGQYCAMKNYSLVDVYVYAIEVVTSIIKKDVAVFQLRNHTECECRNRSRRDKRSQLNLRHGRGVALRSQQQPYRVRAYDEDSAELEGANALCQCPYHFDAFPLSSDEVHHSQRHSLANCRCDCHSRNAACQRFKNGSEGFSLADRRCIAEGDCQTPTCTHGAYSSNGGRCPRPTHHDYGYG